MCVFARVRGASTEWIIVVLLWQSVQYLSKVYPTLDMLLLYAQCLSIIQGFNVPWPKDLYQLTMVMSIVNFNIDAVTPACAGISWNYYKSFWFTIFLPVMFGIGHLAWVGENPNQWIRILQYRFARIGIELYHHFVCCRQDLFGSIVAHASRNLSNCCLTRNNM
jgi:hypothetical protein